MSAAPPDLAIYGAGRLGLAVAGLARSRGLAIGLWNPRPLDSARAARVAGLDIVVSARPAPRPAGTWLVCVPDDAVEDVATALAATESGPWPVVAAHCAGALPVGLLAPLGARGAALGTWHPAMTLRGADSDAAALARARVALAGEPRAIEALAALSARLGLETFVLADDRKSRYHAALVFASNGRVALDGVAESLLVEAGLTVEEARRTLGPLIARTDENVAAEDPVRALTGPVARGDARTVRRQLEALADRPAAERLYRALTAVTLDLVPAASRREGHERIRRMVAPEPVLGTPATGEPC